MQFFLPCIYSFFIPNTILRFLEHIIFLSIVILTANRFDYKN